jgi:hypothetical protein
MILMIGLKTLKESYPVDDNIEDKYILPVIQKCQDFIIAKVLGLTKYNQLLNDIENDSVSESDEILIKTYIHPIIGYYVLSEVIYATAYKIKNNPDYQNNPNSDRFEELTKISKKYLNDSQTYEQILRDYICREGLVLPTTDGPVKRSGYSTGLFLG